MHDTQACICVEARVLGKRRSTTAPWHVPLPPALREAASAETRFLLRDLIAYLVREEVHAFQQRQEERGLLHVLQPQELIEAVYRGKIAMGGTEHAQQGQSGTDVDEDVAVQIALRGFDDGLYLVFIDGQQQHNLDAPVAVNAESILLFLHLIALAGG